MLGKQSLLTLFYGTCVVLLRSYIELTRKWRETREVYNWKYVAAAALYSNFPSLSRY